MSPRLAFAIDTAMKAGRLTLAHFQNGAAVDLKTDSSPVTVADRDAERLMREEIAKAYPDDAILGEEEGAHGDGAGRWVMDPIDGTKSFISGVPLYATLLAYERHGYPMLGVCYFPALNELLYAELEQGCYWNGRPARVSATPSIEGAVIVSGSMGTMARSGRLHGYQMLEAKAMAARTWSDAYGHALVATGRAAAMIDPVVARWDISAMAIIVREAGGRFTDFDGTDALAEEAISSNGLVHDEVLEAFRN
jgi:histidinol-phosphatase